MFDFPLVLIFNDTPTSGFNLWYLSLLSQILQNTMLHILFALQCCIYTWSSYFCFVHFWVRYLFLEYPILRPLLVREYFPHRHRIFIMEVSSFKLVAGRSGKTCR